MKVNEIEQILSESRRECFRRIQVNQKLNGYLMVLDAGLEESSATVREVIRQQCRAAEPGMTEEEFWELLKKVSLNLEDSFETTIFLALVATIAQEVRKLLRQAYT